MIFRVLADGQSAAFIINALNRKDQWNLFEDINISTFLEVEEIIRNSFREERKLKEEEKKKREDKTDAEVPVLGQVRLKMATKTKTKAKTRTKTRLMVQCQRSDK